jgi:tRNA (adenine22-N1)-methyltransferase
MLTPMVKHSPWAGRARLGAVASLVPPGSRVADVGTDHGLLPRRLLASGRASHCIASDLSSRAVGRLEAELGSGPQRDAIELRTGNGLDVLRPEDRIDVLVLAGMGAERMIRLLRAPAAARLELRRLVLQPQTDAAPLRRWLHERGWHIVDERLVEERGRYYVALAVEPGGDEEAPTHPSLGADELLEAGPLLVRSGDPLVRRMWEERLARSEAALRRAADPAARRRLLDRCALARRILDALPAPRPRAEG